MNFFKKKCDFFSDLKWKKVVVLVGGQHEIFLDQKENFLYIVPRAYKEEVWER